MDLQISVFLLFILFTAGHTLRCFSCRSHNGTCADQTVETCTNGASYCWSYAYNSVSEYVFGKRPSVKFKGCTTDCQHGSVNIGISTTTSSCCNTDLCNVQDVPDAFNIPNGRKCFSCDGKDCTHILNCTGSEDRCLFVGAETSRPDSFVKKGCISKSVCDSMAVDNKVTVIKCCEGNLCNGAANTSSTQNITYNSNNSVTNSTYIGANIVRNAAYNGNNGVTNSTHNGNDSITNSTYNGNNSVRNAVYNGANSVRNAAYNGNDSVTDSKYNGNDSITNSTYNSANIVKNATYNGNNGVTNSTHNGNDSITNSTYNGNDSITNSTYNGNNSVRNAVYNGANSVRDAAYNGNDSVTNSTYNGNDRVTNSTYNGANSVSLSFLFFCCSLLYFLLQ